MSDGTGEAGPSRRRVAGGVLVLAVCLGASELRAQDRLEFTRMVAHWADYADPGYLSFIEDAKPEIVQVGFYGAHFWGLVDTPFGSGYPAHFPVRGHRECAAWFRRLNGELHSRGARVIGHLNLKFLVGDPESPEGPRGFFRFWKDWDEELLGPKPDVDALDFLERDARGTPISNTTYSIGGMREYWACLNQPAWREVLKAWVRFGIAQGVDGFIVNYFYRHDCHCEYCIEGFRRYLRERFSDAELRRQFGIRDLASHVFDEIGAWHAPAESTPLRREALRFSQIANKEAFDDVFVRFGRSLDPDLIVAQWNHLGDFDQIEGDERCLLPAELWGRDEDYLWYSTGGATNATDLEARVLGEATLQMRTIRGAFEDKPFTLGRYENVRIRSAIAELAANGGAPMGFYTRFDDPDARREIVRYYRFLARNDAVYRGNRAAGEALLLYPRRRVHEGDVTAVERFKELGRELLDRHVLFDVVPDDVDDAASGALERRGRMAAVLAPPAAGLPRETAIADLPPSLSRFDAPQTVRVSASRSRGGEELDLHLVNYDRVEPEEGQGAGIADEKPRAAPEITADVLLPEGTRAVRAEFSTPEVDDSRALDFESVEGAGGRWRARFRVPSFLVYGVVRLALEKQPVDNESSEPRRRIAALVTEYRHNSHADVIVSRLLLTDTLDGKGKESPLELASLYTDQRPENDISRLLAASHRFRLSDSIEDALTLGTGRLAVDGVLLVAEHGNYPKSPTGNTRYPKRRFFEEMIAVFEKSGRVVPVFIDKHLADNWEDAKYIYDTARELGVPLMAGSSLPVTWRRPPADVPRDAELREIVTITYHTTDAYGFHALELSQVLAENRRGGETGIVAVQSFAGHDVWRAFDEKAFDVELFDRAWDRLSEPRCKRDELREHVREPRLFRLEYADGLRAHFLELNGAVGEWAAAWRDGDGRAESSLFWTQEGRPGMHFTYLLHGIERMMLTGTPSWNVERTLLTSGALDALLRSLAEGGRRIETPYLEIEYHPVWRWSEPPPPPPARPWSEQ